MLLARSASRSISAAARSFSSAPQHTSVQRLQRLFDSFGESDYIGEPVSITQHNEQAAAAARAAGEADEVVAAALLHDVGHLLELEAGYDAGMGGCGNLDHEASGAEFLRRLGLSEDVAFYVRHHVNAKRYLCARDPAYFASLSEASKQTLGFQGGPMSDDEAARCEADPRWPAVVRFRSYDEAIQNNILKLEVALRYGARCSG